jgi:hypothetical protein
VRRFGPLIVAAAVLFGPATPAFAHSGDTAAGTAFRTVITGISTSQPGLAVRTVEAGVQLELSNDTGRSVEVLGYAGEPYLDVRPDGTWENVNSPAAYLNETATFDHPVPASADPTAPPSWRKLSGSTTVRWHDRRTHWLEATVPAGARHLRDWAVPLREQVRTFEIRGTLSWEPPPTAWLWWLGAGLTGLAGVVLARRWTRPVTLIAGLSPLVYVAARALDGGSPSLVLILAGLLTLGAAYRHPPFYLALSGAVLALFAGAAETSAFTAAVLPAAGPGWLSRAAVMVALGTGAALTLTGVLRLRAALPAGEPDRTIVVA